MEWTIGQVAQRAGLRPSAVRYYERVGLLPAPRRVNGRRRYGAQVVERLEVIRLAQRAGFTLSEIQTLFHGFPSRTPPSMRWRRLAREKLVEVDMLIARARQMKRLLSAAVECRCRTLEECARLASQRAPDLRSNSRARRRGDLAR